VKYNTLGASRLEVSDICLGTMNFGRYTAQEDAFAIMDKAHELGINYFDTANSYGVAGHPGLTEEIIGSWFATGGSRREKTVLATKVFEGPDDWPNRSGLSVLNIVRTCEESLRRLQTDYIDILQMHHVDRRAGWDEIWEAYDLLKAQGKVLYAGSSNFAGWHIATAQNAARARKSVGLISEQSIYNLSQRTVELEVLPAARAYGLGVVVWSPLAGGLLARKSALPGGSGETRANARGDLSEGESAQLGRYFELADSIGTDPAQIGLAWVLANPAVAAVIVGPRTVDQLCSSAAASDVEFSPADLVALDVIWPGPGGAAPEAYAW